MGAFGDKLRKQREQRGIALDAISNTTKISPRMLRALEEERFDQLPGGVFNKGFVRAYARQIGLNEEEAVSDYLSALRESQVASQKILPDMRNRRADALNDLPAPPPRISPPREPKPNLPSAPVSASPSRDNGRNLIREKTESKIDPAPIPASPSPHAATAGSNANIASAVTDRRLHEDRRTQERRLEARRVEDRDRTPAEGLPHVRQADRQFDGQLDHQLVDSQLADQSAGAGDSEPEYSVAPIFGPYTIAPSEPQGKTSIAIPWRQLTAALVLVFIVVAVWNLSHRDRSSSAANTASDSAAASTSAEPQPPAAQPAPVDKSPKPSASPAAPPQSAPSSPKPLPAPSASPSPLKPPSQSAPAIQTAQTKTLAANSPASAAPSSSGGALASPSASHVSSPRPSASVASSKTSPTFTLVIRAEKTAWISITADGNLVAQETLIAPASTSVRASNQVVVRTGNAGGISFRMGDRDIPAEGLEGQIRTFTFDGSNVKISPPQAPTSTH